MMPIAAASSLMPNTEDTLLPYVSINPISMWNLGSDHVQRYLFPVSSAIMS